MAYATQERNRAATLAAVGALHAGVIYALVVGLAGPVWKAIEDPPLVGEQIALPKPPPEMIETTKPHQEPKVARIGDRNDGKQVVEVTENPIFEGDDVTGFPLSGGGTITEFGNPPLPPQPPAPTVTPKSARPIGKAALWVTPNDYPAADLRSGHEGVTRFQLSIGADGKVLGCEITVSSGFPTLDAAACANLRKRAKLAAATDSSGAAVPGTYTSAVHWKLPKDY